MLGDMEADNVDFATHHYTPRRVREGDFCQVSYFVAKEAESANSVFGGGAILLTVSIRFPGQPGRDRPWPAGTQVRIL